MPPRRPDHDARVAVVAQALRVDAATLQVFDALARAGIDALLLKGAAIASWLYTGEQQRYYHDCDLLIDPESEPAVSGVLGQLGFSRCVQEEDRFPGWWREGEHASEWVREADGVRADLHRTLPGLAVDGTSAWIVLAAGAEHIRLHGDRVPCLGRPARALHIVLHAAQHGPGWGRPMEDLRRLLSHADADLWEECARVASELGATEPLAAGLHLLPEGAAVARRLGLSTETSREVRLRASVADPAALTVEGILRAPGLRARLLLVLGKLVPPPAFMRHWWPPAGRSRIALVYAYVWRRPWWIARTLPAAIRGWWGASRDR